MYPNQYNQLNTVPTTNQNIVPTNQNIVPTNYAVNQITAIPYGQIPLNFHPQNLNYGFPTNPMANYNANALNMPQYNPQQYNAPQYNPSNVNAFPQGIPTLNAFQQNAQNMLPQGIQNVNALQQNIVETGDRLNQEVADALREGGGWPSYSGSGIGLKSANYSKDLRVMEICKDLLQERGSWAGKPRFETWSPREIRRELGEKYGKTSHGDGHDWFISTPRENSSDVLTIGGSSGDGRIVGCVAVTVVIQNQDGEIIGRHSFFRKDLMPETTPATPEQVPQPLQQNYGQQFPPTSPGQQMYPANTQTPYFSPPQLNFPPANAQTPYY
jgi:hypothetical protein